MVGPPAGVGLGGLVDARGALPPVQAQGDGDVGVGPVLGPPGGEKGHRPEHPAVFQGDLGFLGLDGHPLQLGQQALFKGFIQGGGLRLLVEEEQGILFHRTSLEPV